MNIYTSYFGNKKALDKAGVVMVSVARWQPRYCPVPFVALDVAPTVWMLKEATSQQYDEEYKRILSKLDVPGFIKRLESFGKGADVALCCYEKPGDFCHRHVLAEYITAQTGIEIKEFEAAPSKPAQPKYDTPSLFDNL